MTPLTVTRRNVVALDFTQTTLIPGTTGNTLYGNSVNVPYPAIAAFGEEGRNGDPGPPNFPERYSFFSINDAGHEFGAYYDTEVRSFVGGTTGALSRDKAHWIITGQGPAEDPTAARYYKTIDADYSSIILSDPKNPFDGAFDYPAGYVGITGGGDAFYPVYAISGVGDTNAIPAISAADTSFRIFKLDGTEYKAFVTPTGFFYRPSQFVTLNDGTLNYSFVDASPDVDGNSVYMSKWTAESTGSAFSQTDYNIVLSDGADDAVFQASADSGFSDYRMIRGNYENFIYVIVSASVFPLTSGTAFVFAKDFSWYDRIDIVADGQLSFGSYFQDIDGTHFLVGTHVSAGCEAFQLAFAGGSVGGAGDGTVDDSVVIRSWGFKLDGHTHIVWRLGPDKTLIFDRQTRMWSRYVSPGRNCWRAHVGQNWLGMASTTFARGFGSDVVAGDDASGVLWILDPTTGLDDRSTTGSDPFIRVVVGGVEASGRQSIPCNAVQMDLALGSPSLTGAAITLETSDDFGHTWSSAGSITVPAGAFGQTVEWRSLGQIVDPGRIFRFSDNGATVRVSGADMR